jgi:hypothetical protein
VIAPTHLDTELYVIHPLDDVQERKCSAEGLGPTELMPTVRFSLLTLRVYRIAMTGLLCIARFLWRMSLGIMRVDASWDQNERE